MSRLPIDELNRSRRAADQIADILRRLARLERSRKLVEDWHLVGAAGEPAFQNTWANTGYGGWQVAGFTRDALGWVRIRGLVYKNGGAGNWVANETIFVLPAGYRPPANEMFAATSNSRDWEVRVLATGEVQVGATGGASNPITFASLSGVAFRVD